MTNHNLILILFAFFIFNSCKKSATPCPTQDEIAKFAMPVDIPQLDKKNIAYSNINKMTFLLNNSGLVIFTLTKNFQNYFPGDVTSNDECGRYRYKFQNNIMFYNSQSMVLPGMSMQVFTNSALTYNATSHSTFTIELMKHYMPDGGGVDDYSFNRNSEFNLQNYTKLDSVKTSFDSVYYNIYLIALYKYITTNHGGYYLYDTIYYSTTKGIVKITDWNNNTFELIKVE